MGCDIHMTVERKTDEKWVCVNTLTYHTNWEGKSSFPLVTMRNYKRFSQLAGVRGNGPSPKGIPVDVSETTQFLINEWGVDGHSHSWLELDEACRIFAATEYSELDDFAKKYPASYYFCVSCDKDSDFDNYRVVFWFDN